MEGKAKRACLSAEAYATRAAKTASDTNAVRDYHKAIRMLTSECDQRTFEERVALARTYMDALDVRVRRIRGDDDSDSGSGTESLNKAIMDTYAKARLGMAWVLSESPVLDFDEINKWLARADGMDRDSYSDFYGEIALELQHRDPAHAFSDRALSVYRAYFHVLPGDGALAHALGLLSRPPVDPGAFEDVVAACNEFYGNVKSLLRALVHANTRVKFERAVRRNWVGNCPALDERDFDALMDHLFGPVDD